MTKHRKRRIVELHADGTVTCWRPASFSVRRSTPDLISVADFAAMRARDRERAAAAHPSLRVLTMERTLVRVRIEFAMALPLGSSLPSPTLEAVESAALAIAGPVELLPGSRVSVRRASVGTRVSSRRTS